jgi:hypothetical protein
VLIAKISHNDCYHKGNGSHDKMLCFHMAPL